MRQKGAQVVNINVIFFGHELLDRFERCFSAIDVVDTCSLSIAILAAAIAFNDSFEDVDGSIGFVGC